MWLLSRTGGAVRNRSISSLESNGRSCEESEYIISRFEHEFEHAGNVQTETLCRILLENRRVEYLDKWLRDVDVEGMGEDELESLYAELVPLTSHSDFEPYIQKIADGDRTPVLTQQPLELLSLRVYPIHEGKRILEFIYGSKLIETKGGLMAGTATTHYYSSVEFRIKQEETRSFTCSPEEVISSGDYKQSTYCHLLLGLYFSYQVEFVTSTFAYSIVQAFQSFEESWREICIDTRDDTLSPRITVPKTERAVLDMIGSLPRPELAERIRSCCERLEGLWSPSCG